MDLKSILSDRILYKHLILMFSKTYEFLFSRKNLYYVVSEENILTLYYHFLFNFIVLLQVLLLLFLLLGLVISF